MSEEWTFDESEMVNNPSPRVAVILCLDTSASMRGQPIEELEEGVKQFLESLRPMKWHRTLPK